MTESIVDGSSPKDERERGLDALAKYFAAARKIVFLTGAGVSTESGIPDFRSTTGIYSVTSEEIFSIEFFHENPERFYSFFAAFYRGITDARPNAGHLAIAELERRCGKSVEVVTQNIDGLHGLAGSTKVHEIHGTLRSATCTTCDRRYEESFFSNDMLAGRVPRCECGGVLKPDVVFYGEELPAAAFNASRRAMWETKLLVVAGTSLQVYPAAGLPRECDAGAPFVVVNKTETPLDYQASLVFRAAIGDVLPQAVARVPSGASDAADA